MTGQVRMTKKKNSPTLNQCVVSLMFNVDRYSNSSMGCPRRGALIRWSSWFDVLKNGKLPIGPQEGAISIQYQQPPKMWRYSKSKSTWTPNHVAAHVKIQTKRTLNGGWESQGNWLIPTTRSSNSRAGKRRQWHTLRVGVTAIKLPPEAQGNSCPL